jgi:chitin synthase
VAQRRFASTIYSILYFRHIYRSSHSFIRRVTVHLQLLYNTVSLILSWFGLAVFLLSTFIITDILSGADVAVRVNLFVFGAATTTVNAVIQSIYIATILHLGRINVLVNIRNILV